MKRMRRSFVWLPLLCALLAGVGAARVGFSPFWLLNVHQDELVIVRKRSFEVDPENGRVGRQVNLASARKIQQRQRHTLRFSVGMSIMIPLKETLERAQIGQGARNPNRPVYLAMLAKPLSLHGGIVAEQHPPTPPTAAPATARPANSSSDQTKGDLRA